MPPSAQGFFPHLKSAWWEMQSPCAKLSVMQRACVQALVLRQLLISVVQPWHMKIHLYLSFFKFSLFFFLLFFPLTETSCYQFFLGNKGARRTPVAPLSPQWEQMSECLSFPCLMCQRGKRRFLDFFGLAPQELHSQVFRNNDLVL